MLRHLMTSWHLNIWILEKLEFDYLKNEKSFRNEIKNIFLGFINMLSFRYTKQTSKNLAGTTLNIIIIIW